MATTYTTTVKSSGGDYTSLSAWEAGYGSNTGSHNGDLVTADAIERAEVYAFNDTTAVVINGWTTDATRYPEIVAASGQGHAGYWDTTKYYLSITDTNGISIYENYVRISGLQIQLTYTSAGIVYRGCIRTEAGIAQASDIRIDSCLFKGVGTSEVNVEFFGILAIEENNGYGIIKAYNCVAFDFYLTAYPNTIGGGGFGCLYGDLRTYNCTAYKCMTGFWAAGTTFKITAVNCLAYCDEVNANYVDFSASDRFQNSDYNVSTDASAPGGNSLINQASTDIDFLSTTSTDSTFLAIDSTSTCVGAGLDDPLSGVYSDDIRGETRSDWDIGADEYVAAGGGGAQQKMQILLT